MSSVVSAVRDTVPISSFNRGLAGKIFDEVKKDGAKVVMKNNCAEAVLLSPEEYIEMQDEIEDYRLLTLAVERMERMDRSRWISQEEVDQKLHITQADLDAAPDVELA